MTATELRAKILEFTGDYARLAHAPKDFEPGRTYIPASGKVFGAAEFTNLIDASLDFWLTAGRFNEAFERRLEAFLGVKHALTVNSGSSANLLAVAALTSPTLGDRTLKPGDEVVTVAAAFPTTVNPLLLYGLVPVFVDIAIPAYNIDAALIEAAITARTRAIVLAHALGNPFAVEKIVQLAQKHRLWLIEDCCDALGSTYNGRLVGSFGDIGTLSFYPAHQITMGEGGAVFTNQGRLKRVLESFRDWGRDCYCDPGKDNTCGRRFDWQLGDLPKGYDHKFIYSHAGYNLKITDMQAAVGLAQLERLPGFIKARRYNFHHLKSRLSGLAEFMILPEASPKSEPAWFGFPVTLRPAYGHCRRELTSYLERNKIGTRMLFGGNLLRQPYFRDRTYRISGALANTDLVMERTFWLGVYPGLTEPMLDYVAATMAAFFKNLKYGNH